MFIVKGNYILNFESNYRCEKNIYLPFCKRDKKCRHALISREGDDSFAPFCQSEVKTFRNFARDQ